jgi:hypothetical protein
LLAALRACQDSSSDCSSVSERADATANHRVFWNFLFVEKETVTPLAAITSNSTLVSSDLVASYQSRKMTEANEQTEHIQRLATTSQHGLRQ